MSDERPMFEYERPAGPPPRWFLVAMIVGGIVQLWMAERSHGRQQELARRAGLEEGWLMYVASVLTSFAIIALAASELLKRPIIRKVVGILALAAWAVATGIFVASFFTE